MSKPSDSAISFEAVKTSIRQDRNGYSLVLSIHPNDVPESLLRCWVGARFQVAMVMLDDQDKPVPPLALDGPKEPVKFSEARRAVAEAGELCRVPAFQNWIGALDERSAATMLRASLLVTSRSEIGLDPDARDRFYALLDRYQADVGLVP